MSGSVASWPATGNVTTRPLPVLDNIQTHIDVESKEATVVWEPNPDSYQDQYKITYYELDSKTFKNSVEGLPLLETFNGDSSSIFVADTFFSLSNLQPGRNYSISISAVSQDMESVERSIFQATRPASPIIEDLQPFIDGLDISWKSDVTSKQEKYVVVYVRNDTGKATNINTTQPRAKLSKLYPGAGYIIKVYALSHGLLSEPHISFTAVYPNPPRNLSVERVKGNKVTLKWQEPPNSLFTGYIIKYRPEPQSRQPRSWTEITDITGKIFFSFGGFFAQFSADFLSFNFCDAKNSC